MPLKFDIEGYRWGHPATLLIFGIFAVLLQSPATVRAQTLDQEVLAAQQTRVEVMRRAADATVAIFAPGGQGGGSGVLISADGYALSNFHVTSIGPELECGLTDGKIYPAVVVGLDPTGDVALVRLLGRDDFPHAPLGDSDEVRAGDWVFAAGNPFLLADDFEPSISYGIVSGVHRYQYPSGSILEYTDCIQTDAAINPGNSGGPLFNSQGLVVGINGRGSFEKRGRVNVGVGYAISINQVKKFLGYLKSGRIVDHATLNATVAADEEGYVYVNDIVETSDAYRRGLRYGDRILQFAGRDIGSVNTFKNVLGTFPRGWRVPLTFEHEGEVLTKWVRLAGVHREGELAAKITRQRGAHPDDGQPDPDTPDLPEESDPLPPDPDEDDRREIEQQQTEDQPDRDGDPEEEKPVESGRKKGDADEGPQQEPSQSERDPRRSEPLPRAGRAGRRTLSPLVQQQYLHREGYANYYFNLQNVRRVWNAFRERAQLSEIPGDWSITGVASDDSVALIHLTQKQGHLELPQGRFTASFEFAELLDAASNPPRSGGLLAALHVWQRLLILGPDRFGEVYYLGTMTLPGWQLQADVLVGVHAGVEARFYFSPETSDLIAVELFSDADQDPCELLFSDFREVQGRTLPYRWQVRHGDSIYEQWDVETYLFEPTSSDE